MSFTRDSQYKQSIQRLVIRLGISSRSCHLPCYLYPLFPPQPRRTSIRFPPDSSPPNLSKPIQTPRPPLFRRPPLGASCGTLQRRPVSRKRLSYHPMYVLIAHSLNTFFQTPVSDDQKRDAYRSPFLVRVFAFFFSDRLLAPLRRHTEQDSCEVLAKWIGTPQATAADVLTLSTRLTVKLCTFSLVLHE